MVRLFVCLAVLALLAGCRTTLPTGPPDGTGEIDAAEQRLVGTWAMAAVYDDGEDVTDEHNPSRNRWIELRADHSFASDGDPYGPNSGVWRYDEAAQTLEIISDLGRDDDSVWTVSFRGGDMVWRGVGSAFAERFTIVARRSR